MLVTASVDRIHMAHRANLHDDMTLTGQVAWVGSSSLVPVLFCSFKADELWQEIQMKVTSSWTEEAWLTANFVFVARHTGKAQGPATIPALVPETDEEKKLF